MPVVTQLGGGGVWSSVLYLWAARLPALSARGEGRWKRHRVHKLRGQGEADGGEVVTR